ncbi:MAG: hypothetical protein WAN65_17025, partial [Candidatus Sulfotelmatobacter sp.]
VRKRVHPGRRRRLITAAVNPNLQDRQMGQELVIPQAFKNFKPPAAMAALNPQDDNLAAGIGQSYGVIGYKGKVWSLRHRGERHNIIRPDDGTPSNHIDVVILGQAQQKSKSYYEKYDPNADGVRPICASLDGLVPDADVVQKQSETCALCPRNVWKTDPTTGRKGRECTDYKRLAVVMMPYQTKPILGAPLIEPLFLRVPPASLTSLAVMGDNMAGQGFHFSTYVTRISFDPNEASPKMVFTPLQGITEQEAPVIMELRGDPTVGRITGGEIVLGSPKAITTSATAASQPTAQTVQPSPTPQPQTVSPSTPVQPTAAVVQQAPLSTGLGSAQPVIHVTEDKPSPQPATTSTSPIPASTADTGFGGVTSLAAARAASSQSSELTLAQQSTADTGEPEASDVDLDARIAGLIKTN